MNSVKGVLSQRCDFKSQGVFLLSVLVRDRSVLTLYVKEKVGADEGEYHHRDRQSAVRHHLPDSGIQIRAVRGKKRDTLFQRFATLM